MDNTVYATISYSPTGPWSESIPLYKATPVKKDGGCIYSPAAHDYYDPSGKTLIITFTNHPNTVQAVKVVCRLMSSVVDIAS